MINCQKCQETGCAKQVAKQKLTVLTCTAYKAKKANMTQKEPKENKLFESVEQLSKIAQDLVRRKTELSQPEQERPVDCERCNRLEEQAYDKDAEIKRLNEKIEFLARANMLYSDWEHRETQVTSELIRKGIEEHKINAELRAEIKQLKQRTWVGLTDEEIDYIYTGIRAVHHDVDSDVLCRAIEAKLKEKNT